MTYKIQTGDTLGGIAKRKKTSVDALLKSNPRIKNPDLIFAGNQLNLPGNDVVAGVKPSPTRIEEPTGVDAPKDGEMDLGGVVKDRAGVQSEEEKFRERLGLGISSAKAYDPKARRTSLEEERGLSEKREQIGSYEQEITKTQELLDTLESDIKSRTGDFMLKEGQRKRVLASEQDPLAKQLKTFQSGLGLAESGLAREESEIDKILGQEKEEAYRPLELLSGELGVEETIQKLFPDQNTEEVASIMEAIQTGGSEDPTDIYNALKEQGLDVGINEIVDTLEKIQSVREEVKSDMDIADLEHKKAQTAKIYNDIKRLEEADDVTKIDESELDPESQSILAQTGLSIPAFSFLTTGVKALTRMSSDLREKFMDEAEEWSIKGGVDISTFQSEFQAYNEVVKRNIKISALVGLSGEDIKLSLDMLGKITKEGDYGDLKFKNLVKLWAGKEVNDPVAMKYKFNLNDLRSAISGFFAVQQGRTQTYQSDMEDAKELISDGLATGSIEGLIETIDTVSARAVEIADQSVGLAQDAVWEMFGVEKPDGGQEEIYNVNGVQYKQGEDGLWYPVDNTVEDTKELEKTDYKGSINLRDTESPLG